MLAGVGAILAAMSFAAMLLMVKRGLLAGGNTFTGAVVNIAVNAVSLWLVVPLFASYGDALSLAGLSFLAIGMMTPGIARWFYYIGVDRIGTARASAIGTLSPFLSVLFALSFLGERLTRGGLFGTILIGGGILLLVRRQRQEQRWKRRDLLFPLGTAVLFATRDNLARWIIPSLGAPVLAAAMATTGGFLVLGVISAVERVQRDSPGRQEEQAAGNPTSTPRRFVLQKPSMYYFLMSGVLAGSAYFWMFLAFSMGNLVTVAPLVYTEPLFILLFSALFLRQAEPLTTRIVAGVAAMVAGMLLVMVWK